MNELKNNLIDKIKAGDINMKPRWHFVLRSLLIIFGVITASLVVVYLLSFVLFTLRQSGVGFLPLYGVRGISLFVMNSPWLLIGSAGITFIALQLLVHKYSFSYRQPLLYSVMSVIALVLFGAYAIEQTPMHQRLQEITKERNVPVVGAMYRDVMERQPELVTVGYVTAVTESGLEIVSREKEQLSVYISNATKQKPDSLYQTGDIVMVFGDRDGEIIEALGIRPAPRATREGERLNQNLRLYTPTLR